MKVTDKQGLFCVEMDAASPTSTYQDFVDQDTYFVLRNLDRVDMVNTLYETRGYNAKFGIDNSYEYFDEMLSMRGQTFENFLLPSRDLFGFCDNFKAASFLKDVDASGRGGCVQSITDVDDAVQTFLNPEWYADRKYLTGSSTGSRSATFGSATKIFTKATDGTITEAASNLPATPVKTVNGSVCEITDFVSEVFYRVFYSENTEGLYTIDDIQIEFMLQNSLELDSTYCDAGNKNAYLVTQRFGIEFEVARESSTGSSTSSKLTTLAQIARTGEVTRSGNPGYQLNQPLIIAEEGTSTESKKVNVLGTYIQGPNAQGECLTKGETGGAGQRIDFGKQTQSSCHVTLNNYAAFEQFC